MLFHPGALRRALGYATRHGLGHLAAAPRFVAPGFLERAFVTGFGAFASLAFRVHRLRVAGSDAFVGIGAFNLVRRADWVRVGGHQRLRLEVVDDLKLGLVLRRSGVAQGALSGGELVTVRWQHGFWPSVLGLVKNAFAAHRVPALGGGAGVAGAGAGRRRGRSLLTLWRHWPAGQWLAAGLAGGATLVGVAIHGGAARRLARRQRARGAGAAALLGAAGGRAARQRRGGAAARRRDLARDHATRSASCGAAASASTTGRARGRSAGRLEPGPASAPAGPSARDAPDRPSAAAEADRRLAN